MKQLLYAAGALALGALSVVGCTHKAEDSPKPMLHAMYAVESEWTSPDDVVVPELDAFDFVYLMAAPDWSPEDFDTTQEAIIDRFVDGHTYAHPEGIRALIDGVHSQGGKILCSFPGVTFDQVVADTARTDKFAAMMAAFINKYDYDGAEVDWEKTVTEETHLDFMRRIRRELDRTADGKRRYWLTSALNSAHSYTPEMAAELSDVLDWVNIMFYDMGGGIWETVPTHNSPLDKIDSVYRRNWAAFEPTKLHIGLPNYGFYYKGISPGMVVDEGKTLRDYGRYCHATELPELIEKGWAEVWDEQASCPYYVSPDGNEFMTLESPRSLDEKYRWVADNGFGGIFWWEYSCDWIKPDVPGERGRHLLTDHITAKIKGSATAD